MDKKLIKKIKRHIKNFNKLRNETNKKLIEEKEKKNIEEKELNNKFIISD